MNLHEARLIQDPSSSFIAHHEQKSFTSWHYHPEFELVWIKKGSGRRIIGDHIDRFRKDDMVLIGANLPHEWQCDPWYFSKRKGFLGEGVVVQFQYGFLGAGFFEAPGNYKVKQLLQHSLRGIFIEAPHKERIKELMWEILHARADKKLFRLIDIFEILTEMEPYALLSSSSSLVPPELEEQRPMRKALRYIMKNYQNHIEISDLLDLTSMSNSAFYSAFKSTFGISYKKYLLSIRIGYACRLLISGAQSISETAYASGFTNISNFNRQFKKVRGITPSEFQHMMNTNNGAKTLAG